MTIADPLAALRAPLLHLPEIADAFTETFHHLALTSESEFLPTPITALPSGAETGRFLALDLGGTNLRVAVVQLLGAGNVVINKQGNWAVPAELKSSNAESLFGWVARQIASVVAGEDPDVQLEMGVTFSFPMEQKTHADARIMPMGKGFHFTTTNDLAALLKNAYSSLVLPALPVILITAITNDTIATLLSVAYRNSRAAAAIIAGTGTNATCICPAQKLDPRKRHNDAEEILVNTEWSIRGTLPAIAQYRTRADLALDSANEKPGFQPFEEMVGGRYLGEIVRLALEEVFIGTAEEVPVALKTPYAVSTQLASEVEASEDVEVARQLLIAALGGREDFWSVERVESFVEICEAVSTRAAGLVAAATVGVLGINEELKEDGAAVVVVYTGTVMERYWRFRERCQRFLDALSGEGRIVLVEALDGGIAGAAVLAGMVAAGTT